MKLKKLLPIASLAGVAAVVAPIVTSCGVKEYNYTFNKTTSLIQEWEPKNQIEKKSPTENVKIDIVEATKLFLTDVKANPEILADELVKGIIVDPILNGGVTPVLPLLPFQTIDVSAKISNVDPETGKLDLLFDVHVTRPGMAALHGDSDFDLSLSIKKLDFILVWYNEQEEQGILKQKWAFEPTAYYIRHAGDVPNKTMWASIYTMQYLRAHNDWSVHYKMSQTSKGVPMTSELSFNSRSKNVLMEALSNMIDVFCFENIYYYENVEPEVKPTQIQ